MTVTGNDPWWPQGWLWVSMTKAKKEARQATGVHERRTQMLRTHIHTYNHQGALSSPPKVEVWQRQKGRIEMIDAFQHSQPHSSKLHRAFC